jgi:hypothetical protein
MRLLFAAALLLLCAGASATDRPFLGRPALVLDFPLYADFYSAAGRYPGAIPPAVLTGSTRGPRGNPDPALVPPSCIHSPGEPLDRRYLVEAVRSLSGVVQIALRRR